MRTLTLLAAVPALIALSTGCSASQDYSFRNVELPPIAPGIQEIDDAAIQGDLVTVGQFADQNADTVVYGDDFGTYVEVHSLDENGWGMTGFQLDIQDNGDTSLTTDTIIACSGPDAYIFDYDEPANDADVTAEEVTVDGEDFVRIEIDADFNEGTTNSVVYLPAG